MTRPTALNYVTCEFGVKGDWAAGYHTGTDYRATPGTRVFSTKRGKVIFAGNGGWGAAYGKHIVVESIHRGRRVRHLYAHLSRVLVSPGRKVAAGDIIGISGETGNVFGAHLHYEERTSPFTYWDHRRPQLAAWVPLTKKRRRQVLKKIGV